MQERSRRHPMLVIPAALLLRSYLPLHNRPHPLLVTGGCHRSCYAVEQKRPFLLHSSAGSADTAHVPSIRLRSRNTAFRNDCSVCAPASQRRPACCRMCRDTALRRRGPLLPLRPRCAPWRYQSRRKSRSPSSWLIPCASRRARTIRTTPLNPHTGGERPQQLSGHAVLPWLACPSTPAIASR